MKSHKITQAKNDLEIFIIILMLINQINELRIPLRNLKPLEILFIMKPIKYKSSSSLV